MKFTDKSVSISPTDFEREMRSYFSALGSRLREFTATHKEVLTGDSGEFEIDVTLRFQELAVEFLVLVECKRHHHAIKRDVVQVLHDRVRAVGAHKGILVATVGFQRGAITYAQRHGIALMTLRDGTTMFWTRGGGGDKDDYSKGYSNGHRDYDRGHDEGYRDSKDDSKDGYSDAHQADDRRYEDGYRESKNDDRCGDWFGWSDSSESRSDDKSSDGSTAPTYNLWLHSLDESDQLTFTELEATENAVLNVLKPNA